MSILSIKPDFLLPEYELIINKIITLQENPTLIASITKQEGVIKLWVFQQLPNCISDNILEANLHESLTNRETIRHHALQNNITYNRISEITIQNITMEISSSLSSAIRDNSLIHMKLQHFLEAGVDFSSIENVNFDELILSEYRLSDETVFPEIDTKADIPVTLKIAEESKEVLIEPSPLFKLEVGECNITDTFIDPSNGKEIEYHISELVCYDIWTETLKQFQDEETLEKLREHGHSDDSIEKMKADIPNSLEHICPKGKMLLLLMYETVEDIQLNFYTTQFLLENPKHNGASSILVMNSSNEKSKYGNQIRSGLLKTVPIGFNETVEVELISWYRKIPTKTIEA